MPFIPAPVPDLVGRTIDKTYKIIDLIGRGAFGAVFRAVDITSDGKQYALKCVLTGTPHSKQHRMQTREWSIHSQVDGHPNIVTLHNVIAVGRYTFLVFDICEGGDLFDAVTERRTYFRNDQLVKLAFVQLIDAVQHCHDRGIFHRDLKPENVLCSPDGAKVWLADFGLAEKMVATTKCGVGSRIYMSPECIGEEVRFSAFSNARSDVWALGVILVNMIASIGPWDAAVTTDPHFRSFLKDPTSLTQILPISQEAGLLLQSVFAFNPFERISLQELRMEVLKVKTFFMTDEEVAASSDEVKSAVEMYANQGTTPIPVSTPRFVPQERDLVDERSVPFDYTPRPIQGARFSISSSDSITPTESSSADSLLVTPETHPRAVADVKIIDITASMSNLAVPPSAKFYPLHSDLSIPTEQFIGPTRQTLLRHAMQRLRQQE
ncbi:kinase-like protein [Artomyces pyxidatus]|uniref:Kinase-like protein n=1 Tax=Artomyces pyxidatus TaxID=48021 RepID=A0ACB8SXV8_9AGAM|nr:kinase-like protein [Artomyces pyxidatus]